MASEPNEETGRQARLRLWPGVVIVLLQWLLGFVLPSFVPEAGPTGAMVALLGGPLLLVWWAFFSRAPLWERWAGAILIVVALIATRTLVHVSIRDAGMGMLYFIYVIPTVGSAFVAWALARRHLAKRFRRPAMIAAIFLAAGAWALVRTGGVTGSGEWDFAWRWSRTHEDRLLARSGAEGGATSRTRETSPSGALTAAEASWPGFRGAGRDSVIPGARIGTEWSVAPPAEMWRRPVGPGWSSFAVDGDLFYTQEQRGEEELVTCYRVSSGEPVWAHSDSVRFWEPQSGAGPRATPTLSEGRVYAFGATGILNVLEAADGARVWSRDAASDADEEIPGWGFAGSPLVVDDVVIVHAGKLVAYDLATGEPRWFGPPGGGYSSPHLATLDGVEQIVMLNGSGVVGVAKADGSLLWEHAWPGGIVQPAFTLDGEVLVSGGGMTGGTGVRRLAISRGSEGWNVAERWTSNRLKPNFNDFVVHEGHAFGFDGSILASMDLGDGSRDWKGGRYGNGQLVLLPEQDLLLVLSEKGELALVEASPAGFNEVTSLPVLEGKTWNHPVLLGDLLLVRNSEQMAAFRMPPAST